MTIGNVLICFKSVEKDTALDNYRSTSCLSLLWKLLSKIVAEALYGHMQNEVLSHE